MPEGVPFITYVHVFLGVDVDFATFKIEKSGVCMWGILGKQWKTVG